MRFKGVIFGVLVLFSYLSTSRSSSLFDDVLDEPVQTQCSSKECLNQRVIPQYPVLDKGDSSRSLFDNVLQRTPTTARPVVSPVQSVVRFPPVKKYNISSSSLFDQYGKVSSKPKRTFNRPHKKRLTTVQSKSVSDILPDGSFRNQDLKNPFTLRKYPTTRNRTRYITGDTTRDTTTRDRTRNTAKDISPSLSLSDEDLRALADLIKQVKQDEQSVPKLQISESSNNFLPFIDKINQNRLRDWNLAMTILSVIEKSRESHYSNNTASEELGPDFSKLIFDKNFDIFDDLPRTQRHTLQSFMKEIQNTMSKGSISRSYNIPSYDFDNYLPPRRKKPTSLYELPTITGPPIPITARPTITSRPPPPPIGPGGGSPAPPIGPDRGPPAPPIRPGGGSPAPPIRPGGGSPAPPIRPGGGSPAPPVRPGRGPPSPPTRSEERPFSRTKSSRRPSSRTKTSRRPSSRTKTSKRLSSDDGTHASYWNLSTNFQLPLETDDDLFLTSFPPHRTQLEDDAIYLAPGQELDFKQERNTNKWNPIISSDDSGTISNEQQQILDEQRNHNYHYHYHSISRDSLLETNEDISSEQNDLSRSIRRNSNDLQSRIPSVPLTVEDSSYTSLSSTEGRFPRGPPATAVNTALVTQVQNFGLAPAPPPNRYNIPQTSSETFREPTTYEDPPAAPPLTSYNSPRSPVLQQVPTYGVPQQPPMRTPLLRTPPMFYGPPPVRTPPMSYDPPPVRTPPMSYGPPPVRTPPMSYDPPPARTPPMSYGPPPVRTPPMSYDPPPVRTPPMSYDPPPLRTPTISYDPPPVRTPTISYDPPPVRTPPILYGPPPVQAPPLSSYSPPPVRTPPQSSYGPPPAAAPMTYGAPPPSQPANPPGTRTRIVFLNPKKGKGRKRNKGGFDAFSVLVDDSPHRSPQRNPGYLRDEFYSQREALKDEYWRGRERLFRQQQDAFNLQQLNLEISLQEKQRKEMKKQFLKGMFKKDKGMKGVFYKGAMALGAMSLLPLSTLVGRRRRRRDLSHSNELDSHLKMFESSMKVFENPNSKEAARRRRKRYIKSQTR